MSDTAHPLQALLPPRYRVLRELGRGGQGQVLLAEDLQAGGRAVAVKVVLSPRGPSGDSTPHNSEEIARLQSEFLTLSRLTHPAVARVREFGWLLDGESVYYSSDFIPGRHLIAASEELFRDLDGPKTTLCLELIDQALAALDQVDRRGLRHGDIKPANILVECVEGDDAARHKLTLVDFGSARLRAAAPCDGDHGTETYAPGQDAGEDIDADLYGLGLSFYQALVGRLPFALGDQEARCQWIADGGRGRLSHQLSGVDPVLDELIARLTSTRQVDAFRSAREAREWIRARRKLAEPPWTVFRRGEGLFGREAALESILAMLRDSSDAWIRLEGEPGVGKTRLLEAIAARESVLGRRVVLISADDPQSGIDRLRELAVSEGSAQVPGDRPDALLATDILSRITVAVPDHRVVVLLDTAESTDPLSDWPLLRELLVQGLASSGAAGPRLSLLVASTTVHSKIVLPGKSRTYPVKHLDRRALEELAADAFAVTRVPADLIDFLEAESSGNPREAWKVLELVWRVGARVDFLGELSLPDDWKTAWQAARPEVERPTEGAVPSQSTLRELGMETAFGVLALTDAWLDIEELGLFTLGTSAADLLRGIDALRWRGIVDCRFDVGGTRWRLSPTTRRRLGTRRAARGLPVTVARRIVRHVDGLHSTGDSPADSSDAALAVWCRLLARSGSPLRASLASLRLAQRLRAQGRTSQAFDQLAVGIANDAGETAPDDASLLCRLRLAELALALGRGEACLEVLAKARDCDEAPPWFRWRSRALGAQLLAQVGDVAGAVSASVELLRASKHASASSGTLSERLQRSTVASRCARWLFQEGDRQSASEHLRSSRRAIAALRSRNDLPPAIAVEALYSLAAAEHDHGDTREATRLLERGRELAAATLRRDALEEDTLRLLSVITAARGDPQRAAELFRALETAAERRGDRIGRLQHLYNLALLQLRSGSLDEAEALFREARSVSDAMGLHPFSGTVWLGLAGVLRDQGQLRESIRLYRRVLSAAHGVRASDRVLAHNNLGEIYQQIGRLDRSLQEREQAVELARSLGKDFLLGVALRNLGAIRLALGRTESASAALEEALALGRSVTTCRWAGGVEYYLAQLVEAGEGRFRALRRAQQRARECRDAPYQFAATLRILEELLARGRRRFVRTWTARLSRHPAARRWQIRIEALGLASCEPCETSLRDLLEFLENRSADGQRWQVFEAATTIGRLADLPSAWLDRVRALRRSLAERMAVRLDSGEARRFLEYHGATASSGATVREARAVMSGRPSASSATEMQRDELLDAWLRDDQAVALESLTDAILLSCAETLGAGVIELRVPSVQSVLVARELVIGKGRVIGKGEAGESDEVSIDVPGPSSARIVLRRSSAAGDPASIDRVRQVGRQAANWLGTIDHAASARRRTEDSEKRARELREELRRVTARLVVEKGDLDTAILSRREGLREAADETSTAPRVPVAVSRVMRKILASLASVATSDLPILILGESGVGKDFLARWIHSISPRARKPFLAETCHVPEGLLEAELFGYRRGAYTSAEQDHDGVFVRVDGGTLYLDEVGGLPAALQQRLLRVLEDRRVRPLGATEPQPVDFRLIAASQSTSAEDLRAADEVSGRSGALRDDLFFRLAGEVITLPPLRERLEDVPELVAEFMREAQAEQGRRVAASVEPAALEKLCAHHWPGNVRELANEVRRALVDDPTCLRPENVLRSSGLGEASTSTPASVEGELSLRAARDAFERRLLLTSLARHRGNATHAAIELGITRRYLGKLLEKHDVDLADWKVGPEPSSRTGTPRSSSRPSKGTKKTRS